MRVSHIEILNLGNQEYTNTLQAMQAYTHARNAVSADKIWIVEHPAVFTLGLNAKTEHLLDTQYIPVVKSDRGGQVTYHGSGQLVIYTLLDIERLQMNVRQLVTLLENAMISTLAQYGIRAYAKAAAPGVYVLDKKIGSIGLRIKQGRCYHGLSLNNAMDLSPFTRINPCGFQGLEMTQLADWGVHIQNNELAIPIIHAITENLS